MSRVSLTRDKKQQHCLTWCSTQACSWDHFRVGTKWIYSFLFLALVRCCIFCVIIFIDAIFFTMFSFDDWLVLLSSSSDPSVKLKPKRERSAWVSGRMQTRIDTTTRQVLCADRKYLDDRTPHRADREIERYRLDGVLVDTVLTRAYCQNLLKC